MLNDCNTFLEGYFKKASGTEEIRVLEAGGGSFSHFNLPDNARLISLDIEHGQLQKNQIASDRIQGDVHALPLKPDSVHMIICFNVIEHLDNPEKALDQLSRALAPGGILVLGCPTRNSLKGIITRLTPIGFHRWYYKNIVGKKDRGDGHYDAFPTPFRKIVSPTPLKTWMEKKNFKVLFFSAYDGAKAYQISVGSPLRRIISLPYYFIATLGRILTFGRWQADLSDLLMVTEKQ